MVKVSIDGKIINNVEMLTMAGNTGIIVKLVEDANGNAVYDGANLARQSIVFDPLYNDIKVTIKSGSKK